MKIEEIIERLKLWQHHELEITEQNATCHVKGCFAFIEKGIGLKADVIYVCYPHYKQIKTEMTKCETNTAGSLPANGIAAGEQTFVQATKTTPYNANATSEPLPTSIELSEKNLSYENLQAAYNGKTQVPRLIKRNQMADLLDNGGKTW